MATIRPTSSFNGQADALNGRLSPLDPLTPRSGLHSGDRTPTAAGGGGGGGGNSGMGMFGISGMQQQDSSSASTSNNSSTGPLGGSSSFQAPFAASQPPPGLHPVNAAAFERLQGLGSPHGSPSPLSMSWSKGPSALQDEAAAASAAAHRWASMLNSTAAATSNAFVSSNSFGAISDAMNAAAATAAAASLPNAGGFNYIPSASPSPRAAFHREVHTSPEDLWGGGAGDYSPLSHDSNLVGLSAASNSSYQGGPGAAAAAALASGALASTLSPLAALAVYGEDAAGMQTLFGGTDATPAGIQNHIQMMMQHQNSGGSAGGGPGGPGAGPGTFGGFNSTSSNGAVGNNTGPRTPVRGMPPQPPAGSPTMMSTERLLALAAAGGGGGGGGLDFGMGYGMTGMPGMNGMTGKPLSSSLYIKNLPADADKLFMYERFCPYGAILSVKVLTEPDTGNCRGVGFVNYAEHGCAIRAIQALHGTKVGEKLLHVSLQTPRVRAMGM